MHNLLRYRAIFKALYFKLTEGYDCIDHILELGKILQSFCFSNITLEHIIATSSYINLTPVQ